MPNKIITVNEYIVATAETPFGTDINADDIEYMLCHQPKAPDRFVYRLRADTLEWELCELSPGVEEQLEEDITAEEALEIITGGSQQ